MTVLAVTTAESVLALVGLAVGLVVLVVVIGLFNRIIEPAIEIRHYADDIREAIDGIARNTEGGAELLKTRDLATAVPGLALAYLKKLGAAS
jgi:hypothetical protein